MARARACHAARQYLSALLHEGLEHLNLFVVDEIDTLDAEAAHFLLAEILALSATSRAARACATGTARTAAFTALSSASAAGVTFAARSPPSGMPFGAVAASSGMSL